LGPRQKPKTGHGGVGTDLEIGVARPPRRLFLVECRGRFFVNFQLKLSNLADSLEVFAISGEHNRAEFSRGETMRISWESLASPLASKLCRSPNRRRTCAVSNHTC